MPNNTNLFTMLSKNDNIIKSIQTYYKRNVSEYNVNVNDRTATSKVNYSKFIHNDKTGMFMDLSKYIEQHDDIVSYDSIESSIKTKTIEAWKANKEQKECILDAYFNDYKLLVSFASQHGHIVIARQTLFNIEILLNKDSLTCAQIKKIGPMTINPIVNVNVNMERYPLEPPSVTVMYPCCNKINYTITENINEVWTINGNLKQVLQIIIDSINKSDDSWSNKIVEPIQVALLRIFQQDKRIVKTISRKTNENGVGYMISSEKKYVVNDSLEVRLAKNKAIANEIHNIIDIINTADSAIHPSVFIDSHLFVLIKLFFTGSSPVELNNEEKLAISIIRLLKLVPEMVNDELKLILSKLVSQLKPLTSVTSETVSVITEFIAFCELHGIKPIKSHEIKKNTNDKYIQTMKDYIFVEDESISTSFTELKTKQTMSKKSITTIMTEMACLPNQLPCSSSSSIFVRYDSDRVGNFIFMITGPEETPYDSGCYIFSMVLSNNHPNSPPRVRLVSGNDVHSLNPNFMSDRTICLSLLQSTNGNMSERWNPSLSNMFQVMISIQSIILVRQPYFNEPMNDTNVPESYLKKYNDKVRSNNITHGMVQIIKSMSNSPFKKVIKNHFRLKKKYIIATYQEALNNCDSEIKSQMTTAFTALKKELANFN